jgi:predicted RecA/RadA family phage recombinase
MATAQFIHDGKSIDYTPGADVSAGDVVVQNDLIGIAKFDIATGALGALAVTGVFDMPKATGSAIDVGEKVYWDAGGSVATTNPAAGANKSLGKTVAAAGDDDETVRVRLSQ